MSPTQADRPYRASGIGRGFVVHYLQMLPAMALAMLRRREEYSRG